LLNDPTDIPGGEAWPYQADILDLHAPVDALAADPTQYYMPTLGRRP
jgi:hypothetical protein